MGSAANSSENEPEGSPSPAASVGKCCSTASSEYRMLDMASVSLSVLV